MVTAAAPGGLLDSDDDFEYGEVDLMRCAAREARCDRGRCTRRLSEPARASARSLLQPSSDCTLAHRRRRTCSEEELADDVSEDLDAALRNLMRSQGAAPPAGPQAAVEKHPEVMDDFIRNFFVKMGLTRTLEQFETEWCAPRRASCCSTG